MTVERLTSQILWTRTRKREKDKDKDRNLAIAGHAVQALALPFRLAPGQRHLLGFRNQRKGKKGKE